MTSMYCTVERQKAGLDVSIGKVVMYGTKTVQLQITDCRCTSSTSPHAFDMIYR